MGIKNGCFPLLEEFWANKKVLVTGHTGFKGSWLSLLLRRLGAEVIGFSLPPATEPNNFTILNLESQMTSIFGDIRDYASLYNVINTYKPEIIFHLAAQALVRESYDDPITTYTTNVIGTANLFECIRQIRKPATIVNVTTDKCYKNKEWNWGYREIDRLEGSDPYSNSKACSELVTTSYRESFFNVRNYSLHQTALASARAGNIIGGGDWSKDRLIPDIISSINAKKAVVIRNPYAIRPWQHVFDPIYGYLLLAQRMHDGDTNFSEAWNFGPSESDSKSVSWIVNFILNGWPTEHGWRMDESQQPHETQHLRLDSSKARIKLKWHPQWNLETALLETIAWYKAYYDGQNMCQFSQDQLNRYLANFAYSAVQTYELLEIE